MKHGIKISIESLTNTLVGTAESFFTDRGLEFDKVAFSSEVQPFLELISETAHFVGAGVYEMPSEAVKD